jgi:hypothetical protein
MRVEDAQLSRPNLLSTTNASSSLNQLMTPNGLDSDSLHRQQAGAEQAATLPLNSNGETGQKSKTQNAPTTDQIPRGSLSNPLSDMQHPGPKQQPDYFQIPQQNIGTLANFHPIYFDDATFGNFSQFDHAIPNVPAAIYSTVGSQMDQRHDVDPYGIAQSPLDRSRFRPLSRIGFVMPGTPQCRPASSFGKSPSSEPYAAQGCRYLVLAPLLQHINGVIPTSIACDLLDLYFAEPSSSLFESASPYVLTQIFRKKSFLHPTNPRATSPALLTAMLWVTAQTSDAQIFKTSPTSRGRICDRLFAICLRLLNPLIHESPRTVPGKKFKAEFMIGYL